MMGWSPRCHIPIFVEIGPPVSEDKICKGFEHGGHLGHVTWIIYINFRSPFPRRLHMKFGFDWSVSEEKKFENVNGRRQRRRRRRRQRTPDHGYTISSPCEPEGSGELKMTEKKKKNSAFPNQLPKGPKFTLPKIGKGQPRVTLYTNFVVLQTLMLHTCTKFQDNWQSGSGSEDLLKS